MKGTGLHTDDAEHQPPTDSDSGSDDAKPSRAPFSITAFLCRKLELITWAAGAVLAVAGMATGVSAMVTAQAGLAAISMNPTLSIVAIVVGALAVLTLASALTLNASKHRWGLFSPKINCLPCHRSASSALETP